MTARQNKLMAEIQTIHAALVSSGKSDQPVSLYAEDFDYLFSKGSILTIDKNEGTCHGIKVKRWERKQSPKIR